MIEDRRKIDETHRGRHRFLDARSVSLVGLTLAGLGIIVSLVTSRVIPFWGCENSTAEILRVFASRGGIEIPMAIGILDDGIWLEAEVRDREGDLISYLWSPVEGGSFDTGGLSDPSSARVFFRPPDEATGNREYLIRLRVNDVGSGQSVIENVFVPVERSGSASAAKDISATANNTALIPSTPDQSPTSTPSAHGTPPPTPTQTPPANTPPPPTPTQTPPTNTPPSPMLVGGTCLDIVGYYGAIDDGGTFVRTIEQLPVVTGDYIKVTGTGYYDGSWRILQMFIYQNLWGYRIGGKWQGFPPDERPQVCTS